ncbi:hypothetical protein FBD94_25195 [Pedobacter hiemivivus]|uniref:Uncharacterized protein n=1 Tax=Pedobacter hiemivivus TaxID=2530454 RepID=A0A4U1FWI0_9SPHI|nr:hypothetical protein [Pedobacter hiemivivus]TKC55287.1 hypothetical protein FBD94_25195 [Pedobacter hiemivivus]
MNRKKYSQYLKIPVLILLIAGISFFAWGRYIKPKSFPRPDAVVTEKSVDVIEDYDPVVLEKFAKVCAKLDAKADEFFISGIVNSVNGADSLETVVNQKYELSKKGQDFYCRFGETETINGNGTYVFVDHILKKIMVGKEKEVMGNAGLPDLSTLIRNLKSEGYQLIDKKRGDQLETINVVNDNHITCKLYSVTFNPESLAPQQISVRLSNVYAPEDKAQDKTVTIDIVKCHNKVDHNTYGPEKIVRKKNASWIPAPAYEGYELIAI